MDSMDFIFPDDRTSGEMMGEAMQMVYDLLETKNLRHADQVQGSSRVS